MYYLIIHKFICMIFDLIFDFLMTTYKGIALYVLPYYKNKGVRGQIYPI